MRFPSLAAAVRRAEQTAARFPLALLSGGVAAVVMMLWILGPARPWHVRIFATALLGLPLFTAIVSAAERWRLRSASRWIAAAALAGGLALLGVWSQSWPEEQAILRFLQLGLAAHLAVAVLAFSRGPAGSGFWQFNRFLLLQYLIAAFYAAVLWIGLALALAAVDQLLGIEVPNEWYPQLMALLAFVFHPWFVLAGVPDDFDRLETLEEYPSGLKLFAQFVLLPLVTVYLVILTLYLGKVLVTREWPSGWIGWLVSGVSVAGVLALLLLHPLRGRADSKWVNGYGRWFFLALLPSLGMLLVAAGKRIGQYGITEPRYFLLVLALWLVALAVFYVATGSREIRPIPVTLGLVAVFTAIGPWGAYATSRRSQLHRLDAILAANGMGRVGAPVPASGPVPLADRRELSAVLGYLRRSHGTEAVAAAIGASADSVRSWAADSVAGQPDRIEVAAARRLGVEYVDRRMGQRGAMFSVSVPEPLVVDIGGFDLMLRVALHPGSRIAVDAVGLALEPSSDLRTIQVLRSERLVATLDFAAALADAGIELAAGPQERSEPLVLEVDAAGARVRLVLESVTGTGQGDEVRIAGAFGYLLVAERE